MGGGEGIGQGGGRGVIGGPQRRRHAEALEPGRGQVHHQVPAQVTTEDPTFDRSFDHRSPRNDQNIVVQGGARDDLPTPLSE